MRKANSILNAIRRFEEEADKNETERGISVDFLISSVCLRYGSGKRYVKEIIQDLVNTKKIQIIEKKAYLL